MRLLRFIFNDLGERREVVACRVAEDGGTGAFKAQRADGALRRQWCEFDQAKFHDRQASLTRHLQRSMTFADKKRLFRLGSKWHDQEKEQLRSP